MKSLIERICDELDGRIVGPGRIMCRCPAHDDHHPSLSVTETDDGRLLVYCHAGCSQSAVISAMRSRGLWPRSKRGKAKAAAATEQAAAAAETAPPKKLSKKKRERLIYGTRDDEIDEVLAEMWRWQKAQAKTEADQAWRILTCV